MGEFRFERIRCWCNITELVGDIARGGDSAVVAHTECESAPLVVGDTRVCTSVVVSRGTVVVRAVWAAPEVGETIAGHTQSVSVCSSTAGFVTESELAEHATVVAAQGDLVGVGVPVRAAAVSGGSAVERFVD